jgi:hypothetical protein
MKITNYIDKLGFDWRYRKLNAKIFHLESGGAGVLWSIQIKNIGLGGAIFSQYI